MRNPASTRSAASPITLVALGALASAMLGANLTYLALSQDCSASLVRCSLRTGPWSLPDTSGYLRLSRQIRADGFGSLTFENRTPGYPALLAGSQALTGAALPALWLAIPLGGLAAASLAWIAGLLAQRRGAALATGLLFAVWFNVHALATMLLTDALHGFLVALGLATALAWRESQRGGWALASACVWIAAQSLRLAFFPVALLLALLLFAPGASRRSLGISAALCAATLLVPIAVVSSNWMQHGLPGPSTKLAYAAACESVPQLKERLGVSTHREAREECRERQSDLSPAERVRTHTTEALHYFSAFPLETAKMLLASLRDQLLFPTRPVLRDEFAFLYPRWAVVGSHALALYWIAAFGGTLLIWRRDRRVALFILGSFMLVMLPSTLIHTAGARYRFPAELLCLPPAVLFGERIVHVLRARSRARAEPQS
jgi:hypothetical protein